MKNTFSQFLFAFSIDKQNIGDASVFSEALNIGSSDLEALLENFSGQSFNNGLYRIHCASDLVKWTNLVSEGFPEFKDRILCFAYDWLGRHFAIDKFRTANGKPLILMLEPGTGEALEIPVNLLDFHNDELVNYKNEALAADFFTTWLHGDNYKPLEYNMCVGYKKPLFLGGTDTVDNLEIIDMEVYWGISVQLLNKTRGLAPGTVIGNISID